jgi:Thiol-activated cytolysin
MNRHFVKVIFSTFGVIIACFEGNAQLTPQVSKMPPFYKDILTKQTAEPPKEVQVNEGLHVIHTSLKGDSNLDVKNGENNDGVTLHMWETNGGDAQIFNIVRSNEAGFYHIKTKWGRFLDVSGTQIITKGTGGISSSNSTKWKFFLTGDGYYLIQSKTGNYIRCSSSRGGSTVKLENNSNGSFAKWRLARYSNPYVSISKTNKESYEKAGDDQKKEENGMSCTSRRIEFAESNFERIITGGIWDKIYPGAIYNAQSVAEGGFKTLDLERKPMTIAVNLVSAGAGKLSQILQPTEIKRSNVWQSISNLLRNNRSTINAARANFFMKQIHSDEQLKVVVGGDFNGWGASVQTTFSTKSRQSRNIYLIKLTQVYFDVVVDDVQQLTNNLPNEEAVYVSSVSYGKIGYLRVESSETQETISAMLKAKYNWGTGNAAGQLNVDYDKVLRESQIAGFVLGGSPTVITSVEQMQSYVNDARWNPNVQIYPVSYKLKFLKDNDDAYVSMMTNYTERICEPIRRGSVLNVIAQSGSDDLRGYNKAYISVNFNDGTSTDRREILTGLGQNQSRTVEINLGREIDLVNVKSLTINHDGTPNNNPFNGGDATHTYDNWDLIVLRVSLKAGANGEVNIYNNAAGITGQSGDKVPFRFSGEKRTAEFFRQP